MKISVDKSKCAGHALCNGFDPEVFPLDDRGYTLLESQDVDVNDAPVLRAAVDACPEGALSLE